MTTPTNDNHDPADDIAVSFGQLKMIVGKIEETFTRALTDLERRTDEIMTQKLNDEKLARQNERKEVVQAINQLSEGMRALAQRSGGPSTQNILGELGEILKPVIQKKLLGENPEDQLTMQVNQLGMLTVKGTLRELLNAQKLQVRRMMKKGDLSLNDIQQSSVADIVLDKALDSHARI